MNKKIYRLYKQAGVGATTTGVIGGAGLGYLAGSNISNFFKFKPKSWQDRLARWGGGGLGLLAGAYLGNKLSNDNYNYDTYKPSLGERIAPYAKGALGLGLVAGVPYLGYKFINNLIKSKNAPKDSYDGDMFKYQKKKWDDRVLDTLRRGDPNELAAIKKNRGNQFKLYDSYSNYTKGINEDLIYPALIGTDHVINGDNFDIRYTSDYLALEDMLDASAKAIDRDKISRQLYPKYYE